MELLTVVSLRRNFYNLLYSYMSIIKSIDQALTLALLRALLSRFKRVNKTTAESEYWLRHACSCSSVYLSVRMEQLVSRWTDFREIWGFLLNSVKNIQVSLTMDKKHALH